MMQTNSCCSLFVARLLAEPYYVLVIEVPMFAPLPAQKGSSISVTSMKWASAGEDKHHAGPELCLRTRTRRGGGPLSRQSLTFWGQSVNKIKRGERPGPRGRRQRRAPPAPPGRGATVGASPCGHGHSHPRTTRTAPRPLPVRRADAPRRPRKVTSELAARTRLSGLLPAGSAPGRGGRDAAPRAILSSAGAAGGYGTGLGLGRTEPTGPAPRDGAPESRVGQPSGPQRAAPSDGTAERSGSKREDVWTPRYFSATLISRRPLRPGAGVPAALGSPGRCPVSAALWASARSLAALLRAGPSRAAEPRRAEPSRSGPRRAHGALTVGSPVCSRAFGPGSSSWW